MLLEFLFAVGLVVTGALKPNSSNNCSNLSLSAFCSRRLLKDTPISTSFLRETSSMFLSKSSNDDLKFSPTLPFILSAFSITFRISPNSFNHLAAVLIPTFGTPGMLSDVSPTKANISLI